MSITAHVPTSLRLLTVGQDQNGPILGMMERTLP